MAHEPKLTYIPYTPNSYWRSDRWLKFRNHRVIIAIEFLLVLIYGLSMIAAALGLMYIGLYQRSGLDSIVYVLAGVGLSKFVRPLEKRTVG